MYRLQATVVLGVTSGFLALACDQGAPAPRVKEGAVVAPPPSVAVPHTPHAEVVKRPVSAEAKRYFAANCVVCHGERGMGDGPGAAALHHKPRAFRDAAWQMEAKDEDLKKIIIEGGAAVGKADEKPPHPDLRDKPELVEHLIRIVRNFAP